ASDIRGALQVMSVDVDGLHRTVRGNHDAGPTDVAIECLVAADHKALEALGVISRNVGVKRAFGIDSGEHVIRTAVVAANGIHQVHTGAVVACRPAPTGVGQRTPKAVERITAVSRRVNGVATRAAAQCPAYPAGMSPCRPGCRNK